MKKKIKLFIFALIKIPIKMVPVKLQSIIPYIIKEMIEIHYHSSNEADQRACQRFK